MDSGGESLMNELTQALDDQGSQMSRSATVLALVPALGAAGKILWVGGYLIGSDRVSGESPYGFGSDATVGLATVAQVGGELIKGIVTLLVDDNRYAALTLLRQFVEVEYLAWAFAEDEPQAAEWLRSTHDERMDMWQPRHLRKKSKGRFRGKDYGSHCELGGHPTPKARMALPDHSNGVSANFCWYETAVHGVSVWNYLDAAAGKLGYAEQLASLPPSDELTAAIGSWRETDLMLAVNGES